MLNKAHPSHSEKITYFTKFYKLLAGWVKIKL